MIAPQQLIEELIKSKGQLENAIRSLKINADQIEQMCQLDDEDIRDSLEAIRRGLNDIETLIHSRLPSTPIEGDQMIQDFGEGGWARFERSFVHDLRNPLGVVLGYSEIFDETLEEFEEEGLRLVWLPQVRNALGAFSEQLQHFNHSLDHLFPNKQKREIVKVPTLIPSSDTPAETSEELDKLQDIIELTLQESLEAQNTPNEVSISHKDQPYKDARVLVVDDNKSNRDLLSSMLRREGLKCEGVASAYEAKIRLEMASYDLILLDLIMPEMTGDELLEELKNDHRWRRIPVLMISGDTELDTAIRCIEMGAEDFLQKPFNRVLLKARLGACIEKKRLSDEMVSQNKRFKGLLNRILPAPIVHRLDQGESMIADRFESTTILFSDLVGFTKMSSNMSPTELILTLDEVFSAFDAIAERYGVEKIKTIGDAYMAAAGLPIPMEEHADAIVLMGVEMIQVLHEIRERRGLPLQMRVGIHSGPVAAGIIGQKRFLYDVWGDTVNVASRLEASGKPDTVHLSLSTYSLLKGRYTIRSTGGVELKGKGFLESYLIEPELFRLKPLI